MSNGVEAASRNPAITRLLAAEESAGLWQRHVLGYPVWPLDRTQRYFRELFLDAPPDATRDARQRLDALRLPLRQALARPLIGPSAQSGRDVWVLSLTAYRRRAPDGASRCIFAEHLREQLGHRLLFLERNNDGSDEETAPDVFRLDAFHVAAMLAAKAVAPMLARRLPAADREAFAPTSPSTVCQLALYGRAMEWLARHWIARARPRAVFVLCGYQPFVPIQRAVRAAGIPLIELQHGIFYGSHPGYVTGSAPEQLHFPDHLVVFGRHFGATLDREAPRWRGRWSVGGHPWLRRRLGADAQSLRPRTTCIVFSQGVEGLRGPLRRLLPELRARLPQEMEILVKPHPIELDAEAYWGRLLTNGVRLARHNDDTYALLAKCRVAVSVFSTVAIEALAAGCASIVLRSPYSSEDMNELVEAGALHLVDDADGVLEAMRRHEASRAGSIANAFFGVEEPEPDFEALVETVRARLRAGPE